MTHDAVDKLLDNYTAYKGRCAYLEQCKASLEEVLRSARATMRADANNGVPVYSDMPHGSGTSDPTARFGALFAEGWEPDGLKEVEAMIREIDTELADKRIAIHIVEEAFLPALSVMEREVVSLKMFDKYQTWAGMSEEYNRRHNIYLSKATMKRTFRAAMEKLYGIAV